MLSKTYTKYIQSLHQRKYRQAHHSFIAEGTKVVMELLATGVFECEQIIATADWLQQNETVIRRQFQGPLQAAEIFELEKVSALSTASEVLGIFKQGKDSTPVVAAGLTLVLDNIQDPGNLGTIIRIADWFGVKNIICSLTCVDQYNPKVVQSTMGSLGRVQLLYTDLPGWLQQHRHIRRYAAALHGKNVKAFGSIKEGLLIIGNESKGISDEILLFAHEKISIVKYGEAESLNAAVATGIILSHIV